MAFQSDQDWQLTKKTVLERNSHMFNNPLMSDITLTCGESMRKRFYAHKYVLATSSPVFQAMFYGDLAEKNSTLPLKHAEGESLGEFLRFLYTDECSLTPEIAVEVLYLANMYIIPSLSEICVKILQDSMKPTNVFTLLEQAIIIDEKELEAKCWNMIDDKTSEAVTSNNFIDIKRKTLINLLKRASINIKEIELFQAVLKWSESECSKKGLEVTGINKRTVLGDAIYQIRFLAMSENEIKQHVASQTGLLTAEEIAPIYQTFNGIDIRSLKWKLSVLRQRRMIRCKRFPFIDPPSLSSIVAACYVASSHSLSFSVNKPCSFHGVCFFGGQNGSINDVTLEVRNAKVRGIFTSELKRESPEIYGFDVMLTPITVDENEVVTMVATINGRSSAYRGYLGRASIEVDGAIVTFTNSSQSLNDTTVEEGQFYEIILSI